MFSPKLANKPSLTTFELPQVVVSDSFEILTGNDAFFIGSGRRSPQRLVQERASVLVQPTTLERAPPDRTSRSGATGYRHAVLGFVPKGRLRFHGMLDQGTR